MIGMSKDTSNRTTKLTLIEALASNLCLEGREQCSLGRRKNVLKRYIASIRQRYEP